MQVITSTLFLRFVEKVVKSKFTVLEDVSEAYLRATLSGLTDSEMFSDVPCVCTLDGGRRPTFTRCAVWPTAVFVV